MSLMSKNAQNGPMLFAKRADICEEPEIYHQQNPELSLKDRNKHLIGKCGLGESNQSIKYVPLTHQQRMNS